MVPVAPCVLAIETSCDDTAAAILDGDGRVLSSVVSSQIAAHRPFGGVVPEIASREHLANWPAVSAAALEQAGVGFDDVDLVAATKGPGLIGSLLVGLSLGRALAFALDRPFFAVHHLEGHLYSPFIAPKPEAAEPVPDPFIGLVVSGGHTSLYRADRGIVETLAETRDDAMGEVFDKVGKRLGLPYPQGPLVDELAERGEAGKSLFAVASCRDGSLDFSFSGLKSQCLREIEKLERRGVANRIDTVDPAEPLLDLLAEFRSAAVDQLVDRLDRLAAERPFPLLAVSGGVAANRLLRRRLSEWSRDREVALRLVAFEYSSDNAAMIAFAALLRHRLGVSDDPLRATAASRLDLSSPVPEGR